jgi:hypothetical protein
VGPAEADVLVWLRNCSVVSPALYELYGAAPVYNVMNPMLYVVSKLEACLFARHRHIVTMKFWFSSLVTLCWLSLASADGFLTSCDPNSILLEGTILTANCLNIVKDMVCSSLDLGRCLKNRYGSIQDDPDGDG